MKKTLLSLLALVSMTAANAQTTADVPMNIYANQAQVTLTTGTMKYYNTDDLNSIDIANDNATVTINTKNALQDVFSGTVQGISFAKATKIINGDLKITESKGWFESLYAVWDILVGA